MKPPKVECVRCHNTTRKPQHFCWDDYSICPHCYHNSAYNLPLFPPGKFMEEIGTRHVTPLDSYFAELVHREVIRNGEDYA